MPTREVDLEAAAGSVVLSERLRGGQSWSRVLRRGQRLTLTDLEGGAAVAALFFNADDPSERYNMPDTLKAQHIARLTQGFVLYSDMGRVLCSITRDTLGWHDTITGHGTRAQSDARYGSGTYQALRNDWHKNTHDNFLVELGKHDLGKRDLGPNLNFFVKVAADLDGKLAWVPGHSKPGASIELRAELNTLVILSNTPHPLDPRPDYAPPPVALEVRSGAPAAASDPCRTSRPENERGFTLTEAYFA
ncbi:MAG TPA: urea amidolyase associated protein UAAP1 [Polyangiaceae bacterium]|nr:urea amidolyase associated protein UAAP1 [Polyangiaceae bacterium]